MMRITASHAPAPDTPPGTTSQLTKNGVTNTPIKLDADALHTEEVLLTIRLRQGLPVDRLNAVERERADTAVGDGLLEARDARLVLTPRGRLLADAVVRSLLG
jgi:coproporphyrinogen III oxidase-like Fe-S oxidoreductase